MARIDLKQLVKRKCPPALWVDLLARHAWAAERLDSQDVPWQRVFVARRARRSR